MKRFLLLIFLLPHFLQAQNYSVDSLLSLLNTNPSKTDLVRLNYQLSRQYQLSDINKAKKHAQMAINLASRFHIQNSKAEALSLLGHAHLVSGEFNQALACHFKSLNLAEQVKDTLVMVACYNSLGAMYHKIKDLNRAFLYLNKAKYLAQRINDTISISKVYNNLGNIYEDKKEYAKALAYFSRAARMQQILGRNRNLAISLHNMGHIYIYLPHPEKGLPYLFQSLKINKTIQNDMLLSGTLGSIAQIYHLKGEPEKAMHYALQSYEWATKTKSSKKINDAAKIMQKLYAERKDFAKAYQYLEIVNKQENILGLEHQKMKAAEITAEHERYVLELQKKKLIAEKENQTLKIRKQKVTLLFIGGILKLLTILLFVVYRSRQRFKHSSQQLTTANNRMQVQNREIEKQRAELYSQSIILQKQNQLLESHNSFKNRVFTIISHDLRTPFNSLKGVLNIIKAKELSRDDLNQLFNLLGKEMEQSLEMLQSLLIWSKSQIAGSKVVFKPVNIHKMVAENIQFLESNAEQKEIVLINSIPADTEIRTDQERLNFVTRNLIQNAIKFTFGSGKVIIMAEVQENNVAISVCDTGKGISSENINKLFKGDRYTTLGTRNEKGTGLGLLLCKELLESMNARISVESELGKGSIFKIILPKSNLETPMPINMDELILN